MRKQGIKAQGAPNGYMCSGAIVHHLNDANVEKLYRTLMNCPRLTGILFVGRHQRGARNALQKLPSFARDHGRRATVKNTKTRVGDTTIYVAKIKDSYYMY